MKEVRRHISALLRAEKMAMTLVHFENEKNQVCQCVGRGGRGCNYFRKN